MSVAIQVAQIVSTQFLRCNTYDSIQKRTAKVLTHTAFALYRTVLTVSHNVTTARLPRLNSSVILSILYMKLSRLTLSEWVIGN